MDLLDELIAPEGRRQKDWYARLPLEVRVRLTKNRRALNAEKTCSYATYHKRLREKYGDLIPKDCKRVAEFLRNDGNNYPDAEADDGPGRVDGTGTAQA